MSHRRLVQTSSGKTATLLQRIHEAGSLGALAVALVAVLVTAALRASLDDQMGTLPFLLFVPAVMAAAALSGFRAGVFATALSLVIGWTLFVPPRFALVKGTADTSIRAISFVLFSLAAAAITNATRRYRADARRSERWFRGTFENASVGIALVSLDGIWLRVNSQLCEILRRPEAELLGSKCTRYVHPDDAEITWSGIASVASGVEPRECIQTRYQTGPSSLAWVTITVSRQPNDHGVAEHLIFVVEDVTDRKLADTERTRARRQMEDILSSIRESFIAVDRDWRYTYVNDRAAQGWGRKREELIGRNLWDLSPEAKDTDFWPNLNRVMSEGVPLRFEVHYPLRHQWYDVHAYPTEDGLSALILNITDQHLARKALEESEERYRFLAEGMQQFVWARNNENEITYMNRHWLEYTGLPLEQGKSGEWVRLVHPEDREKVENARALAGSRQEFELEFRIRRASDGAYRWHLARGRSVPDASGRTRWIGIGFDIQDLKHMEEALRVSESRFRGIVEAAAEGIWIVDDDGRTTFANARMGELLGFTPEEILGRSCFDFIHPDDADRGRAGFRRRKHQADVNQREYRFIRRDGTVIWLSFIGSPLHDAEGGTTGILAMCTDTTERRRAEERIVQLNRQLAAKVSELETLLSVVPVGIAFSHNAVSGTARLNVAAQRILGIEGRDSLLNAPADSGSFPFHLLDGDHKVPDDELPMQVAARTGQPVLDAEYELVRVDGQIIPILCSASPLLTGDGQPRGSVFAMIDISERKATETALRRANAALEQFAYAAAHDLQEPVRNVAIYTQLLARAYQGRFDEEADVFLDFIVTGARRIQNLIGDLLSYTRATDDFDAANTSTDATAAMNEVLQNLRVAIADSHATVRFGSLPSVRMRQAHLVQVLQNLISNAIKYRGQEDPIIRVTAQKMGRYWLFAVEDNGQGIAPEHHERIFRVFKRLHGQDIPGTGIGLAICERVVTHYGGRIWVESEECKGSAFCFTIPAVQLARPGESAIQLSSA